MFLFFSLFFSLPPLLLSFSCLLSTLGCHSVTMGTRSTHRIITNKGKYRRYVHFDGYISGVGMLLLLSVLELMVAFNYDDIMTLFDDSLKVFRLAEPTKKQKQEIARRSGGKPLSVLFSRHSDDEYFQADEILLSKMVVDYGTLVCDSSYREDCHYILDFSKKTFKTHSETLVSDNSEIGFEVPMTVEALLGKAMWFCKPDLPHLLSPRVLPVSLDDVFFLFREPNLAHL